VKGRLPILGQPNPEVPRDVHLVGRYALGVTWADDHGSIYPFDQLRRGCECGACSDLEEAAASAAWPRDIKRTAEGLTVTWSDAHASLYPYASLRARCRCAACTGAH
jgi:DUF971 family protein